MSTRAAAERAARAAARKSWPIRAFRPGEEPGDDLSASTTAAERLAMVWPLTLEAWSLTGKVLPDYPRSQAPIRAVPSRVTHPKAKGKYES
jgi:hypothetical protein